MTYATLPPTEKSLIKETLKCALNDLDKCDNMSLEKYHYIYIKHARKMTLKVSRILHDLVQSYNTIDQ